MGKIDRNVEGIGINKKMGNIFESISFIDLVLLSQKITLVTGDKSGTRNNFTTSFGSQHLAAERT